MEKIILRDIPDLNKIDVYLANGGYSALKKVLIRNDRRSGNRGSEEIRSKRKRRSLFFYRVEVVFFSERTAISRNIFAATETKANREVLKTGKFLKRILISLLKAL